MFAVIDKTDKTVIRTCNTKEAVLIAAQLEKDKRAIGERETITAVVMDDGGYTDILF